MSLVCVLLVTSNPLRCTAGWNAAGSRGAPGFGTLRASRGLRGASGLSGHGHSAKPVPGGPDSPCTVASFAVWHFLSKEASQETEPSKCKHENNSRKEGAGGRAGNKSWSVQAWGQRWGPLAWAWETPAFMNGVGPQVPQEGLSQPQHLSLRDTRQGDRQG